MQNNYKISTSEAVGVILIVMVSKLILNISYYIINSTGTGSLINLIYIGIIGFIFVLILNKLFKNFPNDDIIDISEYIGGNIFKKIIGIIFILFFIFVTSLTLCDFALILKTIYFQNSPIIFIIFFFIIGITFANFMRF